jgi:hypothetical protein
MAGMRRAAGLALLCVISLAAIGDAAIAAPSDSLEITDTNVKSIKAGKSLLKTTPLKLSASEWVRFYDRGSGASRLCVGKYDGQLQNCPPAKPCGLLDMMSNECGKNGIALP